jgi:hypothetical protein
VVAATPAWFGDRAGVFLRSAFGVQRLAFGVRRRETCQPGLRRQRLAK